MTTDIKEALDNLQQRQELKLKREIICLNIGQSGVQLSNAAWELFCIEHGIQANGKMSEEVVGYNSSGFSTFFDEIRGEQYVPRCVTIDLEPTVIDEVRNGPYRNLFHPDQLISGCEDAANNYARGYHTVGKLLIGQTLERIRKLTDNCENIQGFIIINSFGGGTGSGFTSLLLSKMGVEYAKRTKFQVAIYPGTQLSTSVVEPYNTLMSVRQSKEQSDVSVLMDNESIYDICGLALDISRPTFNNLNRLIAQVFSSFTVSLRFENALNCDLNQIVTNLVPYPIIHYPLANYAPILSDSRAEHQDMSTREITRALFEPFCQMVRCNVTIGRYMSCCLQYRGDVNPREVNEAIFEIKRRTDIQFVDWCPTGFKLSINCQPPVSVVGSEMSQTLRNVCMLANSSAITQVFSEMNRKYDVLFAKRAFVHWYVQEGLEEGEFSEVRDHVASLEKDYEEICGSSEEAEEDESEMKPDSQSEQQKSDPQKSDGGNETDDTKENDDGDDEKEDEAESEENTEDDGEDEGEDDSDNENGEETEETNNENYQTENSMEFEDIF